MGHKKRLRKQYEVPMRQWNKERIEKEGKLREEYGLKNARELWRMQTILRRIRREARRLLAGRGADTKSRQDRLLKRVKRFLVRKDDITLDDILSLQERDILDRRLQSQVFKKRLATTPRQARQLITHGHIAIDGQRISAPSYLVKFDEEDNINWFDHVIALKAPTRGEAKVEDSKVDSRSVSGVSSSAPTPAAPAQAAPVANTQ